MRKTLKVGKLELPGPIWILGPDVIESEGFVLEVADEIARIAKQHKISVVFKASYEKANRSSLKAYRGPGQAEGLRVLEKVKERTGLPLLSDVHSEEQVDKAAALLDVMQVPAFLCRQNALLEKMAQSGNTIFLKKGQFLSPWEIASRVEVLKDSGAQDVWIGERGVSFGYQRLVNDFRVVPLTQKTGAALIFDATHSVQKPGGGGNHSLGEREFIPVLARAAAGAGADGFFFEVHPRPDEALCDGPTSLPLDKLSDMIAHLLPLTECVRKLPSIELPE